jgi:hypothetical protein
LLARGRSSWTRAVMSCGTQHGRSRSRRARCCSRSRAHWAKRGPETCRGRARRARIRAKLADESHRARLRVEIGGFARRSDAGQRERDQAGFALAPRRARRSSCWRGPSRSGMRRCSPSSPTASRGRARRWRLRLEPAAHRAAGTRRACRQGKVQSFGRGRARRWMTPPVPGFPTDLLLPGPLRATRIAA